MGRIWRWCAESCCLIFFSFFHFSSIYFFPLLSCVVHPQLMQHPLRFMHRLSVRRLMQPLSLHSIHPSPPLAFSFLFPASPFFITNVQVSINHRLLTATKEVCLDYGRHQQWVNEWVNIAGVVKLCLRAVQLRTDFNGCAATRTRAKKARQVRRANNENEVRLSLAINSSAD